MNEFCKRRPPAFHGGPDPTLAKAWLKETKVIFRTLDITQDGDRVALATYQLKGKARNWWELMETTHNVMTMTFAEFENIFLDKYFPTPMKQAKAQEFMNLQQESMTVTQYAAKFEELSRYAQNIILTKDDKARRFELGLNSTRTTVVGHAFPTYSEMVKCALRLEREDMASKARLKKTVTTVGRPIRTGQSSNNNNTRGPYPARPFNQQPNNQQWRNTRPMQNQFQRPPQGTVRDISTVQCYNCQALGHYSNQCPQPRRERPIGGGNRQQFQSVGFGNQNQGGLQSQQNVKMPQVAKPPQNNWNGKKPIGTQQNT
ncbi:uncharacterized protein LOC131299696 [Rhododendron vialii]|uniref:uncharacterized protein LOC131299696 n=1 Tax=Rhododendron vialii TaxID=182163 RepID=UPI0026604E71|nr:uncharacterized protein LOC131299696 [Rhododendron vialii]